MASLIGKALQRNAAPVPMGDSRAMPSFVMSSLRGNLDQTMMQLYKTNGTVNANVSLLATGTAGPVWKLFRSAPQDGRRRFTTSDQGSDQRKEIMPGQHQALNVLGKPASMVIGGHELNFWTQTSLFEISQIWLETTGKSHWVVDFGGGQTSFPTGLWPVAPNRMTPVPHPENYLAGWIYESPDGNERIPLQPWEVIFNRYPDPEDPYGGSGPIGSVLTDIEAANSAAEWNRNFFNNSALPGGVLQADHELDDDEFNRLTNRWREAHRGVNRAHRVALLEAGVTWVQTHLSMKDMDFGGLRLSSRDVIREALGMHKVMTGVTDDVNRANAQTGEEVFASWKIKPRLERWRDVLNYQFLPLFGSTGVGVEFDFVLPTPQNREQDNLELKTKSEAALALVTAGGKLPDVLVAVGLPEIAAALDVSTDPALPPRWTAPPPAPAPAAPAAPPATAPPGQPAAAMLRNDATLPRAAVNYRAAAGAHACGDCAMFQPAAQRCDLVAGQVEADMVCDRWTPSDMQARTRKVLGNGHQQIEVEALRELAGRQ